MRKLIIILLLSICSITYAQNRYFTYDNLGRLTQIQYNNGTTVQYSYDANGNRMQHIVSGNATNIDLSLSSLSVSPTQVSAGNTVYLSAVNNNSGNAVAPSQYVKVWRSADTLINAGDVLLDSIVVSSVSAMGSFSISNWAVTIPSTTTAGSYYLILKTDANNAITETTETNNTKYVSLTVTNCPSITITETITNATCGAANGGLSLSASGGASPYQYSVNNGVSYQVSNSFSNLLAATYTCRVKDANNCTATKIITIGSIGGNVPAASFTSNANGLTVSFTNTSQNATSYVWDFGDGNSAVSMSPTHTYSVAGSYNVCLTATGSCGSTQLCQSIYVGVVPFTDTMRSWDKQFWIKATASTERFFPRGIAELSDSSVVIFGEYYLLNNGSVSSVYPLPSNSIITKALYMTKLSGKGQHLWTQYTTSNAVGVNFSRANFGNIKCNLLSNDNIVINIPANNGSGDAIITFSANGALLNYKDFSYLYGGNNDIYNSITKISTGYIKLSTQFDFFNPNGDRIAVLQKLDSNFNLLWTKSYRLTYGTHNYTVPKNIIELSNGDLFIVGILGDVNLFSPGTTFNTNVWKGFYFKTNSAGDHLFHKILDYSNLNTACIDVIQSNMNEVLIASQITSNNQGSYLYPAFSRVNLGTGSIISTKADTSSLGYITQLSLMALQDKYIACYTDQNKLGCIDLDSAAIAGSNYPTKNYGNLFNTNSSLNSTQILKSLGNKLLVCYTSSTGFDGKQRVVKIDSALNIDCGKYTSSVNLVPITFNINTVVTPQIVNQVQTISASNQYTWTSLFPQDSIFCNYHPVVCNVQSSFTKSSPTACLNQTINFGSTSSNALSYIWFVNGIGHGTLSTMSKTFTSVGTYQISLVAINGQCRDTSYYTYTIQEDPNLYYTTTSNTFCGQNTGAINFSVFNGVLPYQYSINNGTNFSNTSTFSNLSAGQYTIVVKDNNGCIADSIVQVNSMSNSNMVVSTILNIPNCSITCNGTAIVSTTGGNSPYTYTISPNATQGSVGNFSGLCANTIYTIIATDASGCSGAKTFNLVSSTGPAISINSSPTNSTVCNGLPITLTASGATSYSWSGGITNGVSFAPSASATYTVTATGANGCTSTSTKSVTVLPSPLITITATPSNAVCQGSSLSLTASGGTSYSWSGGITNGGTFTPTVSTIYTVTATNANSCTATKTQIVFVSNCGNCPSNVVISTSPYSVLLTESSNWIQTSGTVLIPNGANARFDANSASYVLLQPGFKADSGSVFVAQALNGCTAGAPQMPFQPANNIEEKIQEEIVVYPNPTTGLVYIDHPASIQAIELYDMSGKRLQVKLTQGGTHTSLDVSAYATGVYYIRVYGYETIKLIKN